MRVQIGLQTNGVLLDTVPPHDRHRQYQGGRGSYAAVSRALQLLMRSPYRKLYSGLLCTVDLDNDPIAVYEALLEFYPPPSTSCCRTELGLHHHLAGT